MRIGVWHNLPSGGGKRALYYHVRGLVERGHHVETWCPSTVDQNYLPLSEIVQEHVLTLEWSSAPVGDDLRHSVLRYRDFQYKIEAMHRHCQDCAQEIDRGDFDVLFANSCLFFRSAPIGLYVKTPSLLYLQEPYRPLYEAMPTLPWMALPPPGKVWWSPRYLKYFIPNAIDVQRYRIQLREELYNARAFDRILVNSYFSRESVLRAYGLDATVCYLGIDTELFAERDASRERFVIGVAAFYPEKNIEFVIEAIAALPEPRPRLVWVGNAGVAWYLENLTNLARSLGVSFEPRQRVTDTELVDLLNRAYVMAYAPRLEPFGFAPLEANACGLPIVAIAEGGVRETIIDGVNGLVVMPDPKAMALAIQRLLDDPDNARKLGNAGHRIVCEKWSQQAAIDRLEKNLQSIVKASRHSIPQA